MTGSLQKKNGKYYAVLNFIDINGKRKQKWISTGYAVKGNKKKAQEFLDRKLKEISDEKITPENSMFADYLLFWLENAKNSLDESTYNNYKFIAESQIIPYFKANKLTVEQIKRSDLQKYVNEKFEHGRLDGKGGLSARSVKLQMNLIKQAFKDALKDEIIEKDPTEFVKMPKKDKYEAAFYTASDILRLFDAVKNEPLFPLIYFTVVFGLRRSEVLGLKWDSIDFENNYVLINHTVVINGKGILEKDRTKNKSSYRSYPLDAEIRKILIQLKEKEIENRKIFKGDYIENDYIFKWDNGKQYRPDYISDKFHKLLIKYDLPLIRFHDLRHSCASLLVANGFQIKDIQEWLGHSDIQTTANIYAHLDFTRKENMMCKMSQILSVSG